MTEASLTYSMVNVDWYIKFFNNFHLLLWDLEFMDEPKLLLIKWLSLSAFGITGSLEERKFQVDF